MDKSALNRATDSTTAPTPGYLYNDIAKTCVAPQTCIETVNFLTSKLSKNNPHVRKKCLKVLAKCSVHPSTRGMFKRAIVQNPSAVSAIKECTQWRGSMDAVTGDQWNVEVREAAKECLEAVYSDAGEQGQQGQLSGAGMSGLGGGGMGSMGNTMAGIGGGGYGNSSAGGGGGGYGAPMGGAAGSGVGSAGGGGGRMEGIGNPMFADPRLAGGGGSTASTLGSMAAEVGGAMLNMIKDPLARSVDVAPPQGGMGSYGGPNARPDPYSQPPPGRNNLALQTGGQWTMASNRGPNAVGSSTVPPVSSSAAEQQNSEYYKARNAAGGPSFQWAGTSGAGTATSAPSVPSGTTFGTGGVGGSWAAAPATTHAPPPSAAPPQMSVAARARAEAHGTVASAIPVTSVGGATPNGMYERNLIQELCPPGGMKAEPPEDKLAEFARAVPSLNADWICPALLDALEEGNPWIMRAKALCVIETVLTVMADHSQDGSNAYADFFYACSGEVEPLANHARASVKGPARRVLALLGVENAGNTLAGGEAAVATSAPAQEAPNLLDFDDPTPPAAPVAAPVAPPPSLASEAISVTSGGGDSLFSGLTTKAANPAPSAMSAPAPVENENDLLGSFGGQSLEDASIPSTPAAGSSDLFGNMIVKSADNQAKVGISNTHNMPASATPAVPGSAFGFLNTPAPPARPHAPPVETPITPPTPAPAPQTFDPLLSLGMPGTNAAATNDPSTVNNANRMAQMQAIAYQQQMMMMQQQMQHMQMGYGGGGGNFVNAGGGPSPMPPSSKQIMGANYMRQVPGVQGDKMTSFSFLGSEPKKQQNTSFDFVKDAMNTEKK